MDLQDNPMKPVKWSDGWLVLLAIMLTLDITCIFIISTKFVQHEKVHPIGTVIDSCRRHEGAR